MQNFFFWGGGGRECKWRMHIIEDGLDSEEKDMGPITSLKSFGKLSTVPYFFGWTSLFHMYRGGGLWSL